MQDFFCVKQRNFFALFEHFAQKYPYFPKSRRCGERFSLFFANSMVFSKKSGKTKKPASAKCTGRQKNTKNTAQRRCFFRCVHREGLRNVHSAFAPFGGKARFYGTLFLRFFTAFRMTNGGLWGVFLERTKYRIRVGRGDSPDRGNVCEADKRVPELGEFCPRR